MILETDSLGAPLRDFEELRDQLINADKRFDAEALSHISYDKLAWCATGMAGQAACTLRLVREEKQNRRQRFLEMTSTDLRQVSTLLTIEQMTNDVVGERIKSNAPKWADLTPRQKVWFKLNCIVNHVDGVNTRLWEALSLLDMVIESRNLPTDFAYHQRKKIEALSMLYPSRMTSDTFRSRVGNIALEIKKLFPDEEQRICDSEVLYNYTCTSDCYRPLA